MHSISEICLASFFSILVTRMLLRGDVPFLLFLVLFTLAFLILLFFCLFCEVIEQIFFFGVWINTEQISRTALNLIFSECCDFDLIGIFPLSLLVWIIGLFKFYSDGFRLRNTYTFLFRLRLWWEGRIRMRNIRFCCHLLITILMIAAASDAFASLWPLSKLRMVWVKIKASCAHFSFPVVIRFLEGSGLPQPWRKIRIQFWNTSNSCLHSFWWWLKERLFWLSLHFSCLCWDTLM